MTAKTTAAERFFSLGCVLCVLSLLSGSETQGMGCECPSATVLTSFSPSLPKSSCCLNFTGSFFTHVPWAAFGAVENLQVLDLSLCNISRIELTDGGSTPSSLRELYLSVNLLTSVPHGFLADAVHLEVLDLERNLLKNLPEHFLQKADTLRILLLGGNRLQSLPASVLRPSLQQLDLTENPWSCTCSLIENLKSARYTNSTSLESIAGNVTCASPQNLVGRTLWSLQVKEVCRVKGVTALFILLPLLFLTGLVLCWCCCRKEKKKESPTFGSGHKKAPHPERNGRRPRDSPAPGETVADGQSTKEAMLKNQLMLRSSSALLGSTRDIYEEVEVKLGSVDSLGPPPSTSSAEGTAGNDEGSKQDLETVSVTEVMKDSADREKAYMTQPTKYYSLVPGLELEDSDHGEYESVDLS